MSIRPNKRRFAIGFYLKTGFTPWGVDLAPYGEKGQMPDCHGEWIMCCGHFMKQAEVEAWVAAGLAKIEGEDRFGRRTLVAGPALDAWVSDAWEHLRAARWSR